MTIKLNLGGGKEWNRPGWENLEIGLGYDLSKQYLKKFKDNSVDLIYTSHCIEHLSCDSIHKLFFDIFRVLKINGLIRIVVPDMDIISYILNTNDKKYLMDGNETYFTKERAKEPLIEHAKVLIGYVGDHRSFFTFSIINIFLQIAGFQLINKLQFAKSSIKELSVIANLNQKGMPLRGFDNSNTKNISLYVEATKNG